MNKVVRAGAVAGMAMIACAWGCTGKDGRNGLGCTVNSTDAGAAVLCEDGTSASISNGHPGSQGAQGTQGAQGAPGSPGTQGSTGEAGISCQLQTAPGGGNPAIVCTDGNSYVLPNSVGTIDGGACTIRNLQGGDREIRCPDGTWGILTDGKNGQPGLQGPPGSDCSFSMSADLYITIRCGTATPVKWSKLKVFVSSGPAFETDSTAATFVFDATPLDPTFTCSLDGAPAVSCTSPRPYQDLARTAHSFTVTATYAQPGLTLDGGSVSVSASYPWTITAQ